MPTILLSFFNLKYLKYDQAYIQEKVQMKITREQKFCF